jgi:hypothetical protein
MASTAISLGFRALRGGSVVVGVAISDSGPRVVLNSFLATAVEGDRLSLEPYCVAVEMERGPDGRASAEAIAAVAEGRRRQGELAAKNLDNLVARLRAADCAPMVAALLVNRAGWITDLLEHSLSAPEHPPIAEGLAVRDALRFAFVRTRLPAVELDEKSLAERAADELDMAPDELAAALKILGAEIGRPWRKEQKLACVAAWVTLATRVD